MTITNAITSINNTITPNNGFIITDTITPNNKQEKTHTVYHTVEICLQTNTNDPMETDAAIRQIIDNLLMALPDHEIANKSNEIVTVKMNNADVIETQIEENYEY